MNCMSFLVPFTWGAQFWVEPSLGSWLGWWVGVCPPCEKRSPCSKASCVSTSVPWAQGSRLPGRAFLESSCLRHDESSLTEEAGTSLELGPNCARIRSPPNRKCRVHEKERPPLERASCRLVELGGPFRGWESVGSVGTSWQPGLTVHPTGLCHNRWDP